MACDYDALYRRTPNALGAPTKAFCNFFSTFDKPAARVLDVGCGQGRDALFIARLGHSVVGVDISSAGIADLLKAAARDQLDLVGHVADVVTFEPSGTFDVLLIDRTLHMLEREDRQFVLERVVAHLVPGGFLLIADETPNLREFRATLERPSASWSIVRNERGVLFMRRES
ncbi:class I SAM-dependent methyltransferase [Roseibium sp.]|uniref:class I SAM-dependent methyltransferase n=1 Tax=Roseibium sp. TaxID=1936156 RepID=UPI003D09D343